MTDITRFRNFVQKMTRLVEGAGDDEKRLLAEGKVLLAELLKHDDWLPDELATAEAVHYQQVVLHCDALERFSVVSFFWGPGLKTPVHDHTVWVMVGVLLGAEFCV